MDIIQNNPYRILGVYVNSAFKERVANMTKMKAFLKVGKTITFPLDLPTILPPLKRDIDCISIAESRLALPEDQMKYAQFWFIKRTPLDEVAFNHLLNGDTERAFSIWNKKECASSLQNKLIVFLILEDYQQAIYCAEQLYSSYLDEYISICSLNSQFFTKNNLAYVFLDTIGETIGAKKLLSLISIESWKQHVGEQTITPIINKLTDAVDAAKAVKGKGGRVRYDAGCKLMKETELLLIDLRQFLSQSDLKYQMIADKVGLEVLQCGIDYYNDSEEVDAIHKTIVFVKFASKTVMGRIAKDRCKENDTILQNTIDILPPKEVISLDKTIKDILLKYCDLPNITVNELKIAIKKTKPCLRKIKQKLEADNVYYLNISTQVVNKVLDTLMKIMEEYHKELSSNVNSRYFNSEMMISHYKYVLESALRIIQEFDGFDMITTFKLEKYNSISLLIKNLCSKFNIPTERKKIDSSCWQSALILHLIVIIASIYLSKVFFNSDSMTILVGSAIGTISWLYIYVDNTKNPFYLRGRIGVGAVLLFILLMVGYWIYKLIKNILNLIKSK